jgi:predicted RNase H-like nuclease
MRVIGVDLAWGDINETAAVAAGPDGNVIAAGWTRGVQETADWIESHAAPDTLVLVDAPLVVANEAGQRACEREVGQRYGSAWVSANSTNSSSPRRAGERLRVALGLTTERVKDSLCSSSRRGTRVW